MDDETVQLLTGNLIDRLTDINSTLIRIFTKIRQAKKAPGGGLKTTKRFKKR